MNRNMVLKEYTVWEKGKQNYTKDCIYANTYAEARSKYAKKHNIIVAKCDCGKV